MVDDQAAGRMPPQPCGPGEHETKPRPMKRDRSGPAHYRDPLLVLLGGLLLTSATVACGDGITGEGDARFTLLLTSEVTHQSVTYSCTATGGVDAEEPFPSHWQGPVDLLVVRKALDNGQTLSEDTLLAGAQLSVDIQSDGDVTLDIPAELGGPLSGNVQEYWVDQVVAAGPWACPEGVPLGDRAQVNPPMDDPPWGFLGRWSLYRTKSDG